MPIPLLATVCLIACHGGPADHFANYAEALTKEGYDVQIYATGAALKKFEEHGVKVKSPFSIDNLSPEEEDHLAQTIAKACNTASIVITDVGHVFDVKIQQALSIHAHLVPCFAYYDNPEPFVPGGYSSTAARVMKFAKGVLFANTTLTKAKIYSDIGKEIDLNNKKRFGIGYYPLSQAEKVAEKRKLDHLIARSAFLVKNGIVDEGQKILVYFGGNNEEYFSKAFPAFLSFIAKASTDLKDVVVVIQQHPSAKMKNQDGQQVEICLKQLERQLNTPKLIISDFSSDHAQVLADAAFYYQTSMGPQFILEGIPTIQIGHETYEDILVRNHLAPTVTSAEELIQVLQNLEKIKKINKEDLLTSLGIEEDWQAKLKDIINTERVNLLGKTN